VYFGFTSEEVLELNIEQFDYAVELLNNVMMRHRRDELVRTATGSQGDDKSIQKLLKGYERKKGDAARIKADAQGFLKFAGGGRV